MANPLANPLANPIAKTTSPTIDPFGSEHEADPLRPRWVELRSVHAVFGGYRVAPFARRILVPSDRARTSMNRHGLAGSRMKTHATGRACTL